MRSFDDRAPHVVGSWTESAEKKRRGGEMCKRCLDGHLLPCDRSDCPCVCNDADFPLNLIRHAPARQAAIAIMAIGLMLTASCAPRQVRPAGLGFTSAGESVLVDPSCITAPVELTNCHLDQSPAACKKVLIKYRRGCEQLRVNKTEKGKP